MRKRKEALCGVVLALGVVIGMFGGCLDGDKTLEGAKSKIQERAAQEQEFEWYVNEEFGYRIKYPTGWKVEEAPDPEAISFKPLGESVYGGERPLPLHVDPSHPILINQIEVIKVGKGEGDLREEFEESISYLKKMSRIYDEELLIQEKKELSLNGVPAMMVKFTVHYEKDPEMGTMDGRSRYILVQGKDCLLLLDFYQLVNPNDPKEKIQDYIERWDRLIDEEILPSFEFIG